MAGGPSGLALMTAKDGQQFQTPEGTYIVHGDGGSEGIEFKPTPKPTQFTLNGKRYQTDPTKLDENGQPTITELPTDTKPAPPKTVARGGSVYDPATGTFTVAPGPVSVGSGSTIYNPSSGSFTRAPLSPMDQINAQIAFWDAQVKAGKASQEQARAGLDDWITRNIEIPGKIQTTVQSGANAEETGDISAATATNTLRDSALKNQLALTALNMPQSFHQNTADLLNKATGSNRYNAAMFTPGNLDQINQLGNAQFLQAMSGISPYAKYLASAGARLSLPSTDVANTEGPPPAPAPAAPVPPLPVTPQQIAAAVGATPYQPRVLVTTPGPGSAGFLAGGQ